MNKVILQLATYALRGLLGGMTLLGALLLTATATDVPIARAGPGQTSLGPCIDDLFPGALGCTANDVRISGIADVTGDGIVDGDDITFKPLCDAGSLNAGANCAADPAVCLDKHGVPTPELCGDRCAFPGDLTSFAATFEIEMNAQERYDIGLFFAVDGDPNGDGALTGTCSISTLPEAGMFERPDGTSDSFVDLDSTCKGGGCPQPQDLCGDVVEAINPIFYDLSSNGSFISAWCIDLDGNDMLNLPNCTSWRQSGANEVCLLPTDAYPGSPSKCNCDTTFEVPINIPPAELEVLKTATPTQVDEPAGTVQFSLSVTNTGVDPNNHVALHTLVDDVYGDLDADAADPAWLSSTCLAGGGPVTITAGGTYTCVFTASVEGGGGSWHVDTVTAMGLDSRDNEISGEDDAAVEVLDLMPQIEVIKSASPTSVVEGSKTPVTFTVEVVNTSPADSVTLVSLTDDIYGELVNCPLPATIPVGESYVCSFTVVVDGPANSIETDTVTAVGMDDEGNPAIASDSATVTVLDDPATIELIKVANPTEVNEPGDDVTYTFTVQNLSSVDAVTITTLDDDSLMKLDFTVPAIHLATLVPGLRIEARSVAFADQPFEGRLSGVNSRIDPVTRSIAVRAILPNPERLLKPGLLMTVEMLKNPRVKWRSKKASRPANLS